MSKISNAAAAMQEQNTLRKSETVTNFMGGDSYVVDPLTTLRMVSSSSIFGEPSYYRDSSMGGRSGVSRMLEDIMGKFASFITGDEDILGLYPDGKVEDTVSRMTRIIDAALDYDFKGTLEWAIELRNNYYIRLNPQVVMVRAAIHPKRKEFTEKYPGLFAKYNEKVMFRADDPMSQMSYYLYINGGKKNAIPSVIKRSWADKLGKLGRYQVAKYKNHEIGMINAVRICHAKSDVISELMQNGTVEVSEDQKTWENLRSAGAKWDEIFKTIDMGHMALLRNLRGFFTEVEDRDLQREYLEKLKAGVLKGKQFPFRYYSAYVAIEAPTVAIQNKMAVLDCLEECIDIAIANMPKLKGRTMCLSDNSGSAWGTAPSEYGTVTVAEIDNLSSVITAMCSEEGYVGKFGDRLKIYPISKRNGALKQAREITKDRYNDVGGNTEGGIWEFFRNAINNGEHWDNIFIYSDQQAGTGGLYGTSDHKRQYEKAGFSTGYDMINVYKLVLEYRKRVFKKVNVFSVQTAGYDNSVTPGYAYRTNLLYGWTGKESVFADAMIREWDRFDGKNQK